MPIYVWNVMNARVYSRKVNYRVYSIDWCIYILRGVCYVSMVTVWLPDNWLLLCYWLPHYYLACVAN